MITLLVLPLIVSSAFGALALLGGKPWPMVIALPIVVGGYWVLA